MRAIHTTSTRAVPRAALAAVIWLSIPMSAAPLDIIICGSGGSEEYIERFAQWGARLQTALVDRMGRSAESVILLTESSDPPSDLKSIGATLKRAVEEAGPEQDLFIYMIGHGGYMRQVSTFHIPGPDLRAEELDRMLEAADARRVVVVNGASSSAGFINALSGPRRIICSATKSVEEQNATEFFEFFIQGLEEGSADQNHDERISVLEAARQAAALTEAWYLTEGLISTEHALIDDNGDGLGERLFDPDANEIGAANRQRRGQSKSENTPAWPDGEIAAMCFIKDYTFGPNVPPELRDRYLLLLDQIEQLKLGKDALEASAYYAELEPLLIEAAQTNREIRRLDQADAPEAVDAVEPAQAIDAGPRP